MSAGFWHLVKAWLYAVAVMVVNLPSYVCLYTRKYDYQLWFISDNLGEYLRVKKHVNRADNDESRVRIFCQCSFLSVCHIVSRGVLYICNITVY
jgi:hypothetical protein